MSSASFSLPQRPRPCNRNKKFMVKMMLLLSLLHLLPCLVASSTRWSEDDQEGGEYAKVQKTHYRLGRFAIQLDNTPTQVVYNGDSDVVDNLRDTVESVFSTHITKQDHQTYGDQLKFEYIFLLDVQELQWFTGSESENIMDDEGSVGVSNNIDGDGIRRKNRHKRRLLTHQQTLLLQEEEEKAQQISNSRSLQQDRTSTLVVFTGATIAFDSEVEPVLIEKWLENAIADELVDALSTTTGILNGPFAQVTSAKFISFKVDNDDESEEGNIDNEEVNGGDGGEEEDDQDLVVGGVSKENYKVESDGSNGLNSPVGIAASIVGVLVVMAGIVLLTKRRRRRRHNDDDLHLVIDGDREGMMRDGVGGASGAYDMEEMTEDGNSEMPAYHNRSRESGSTNYGNTGRTSIAGSVDDSASGISGYTGVTSTGTAVGGASGAEESGSRPSSDTASRGSSSNLHQPSRSVYRENFDRETRLQKDMLQGDWGYLPTKTDQANGRTPRPYVEDHLDEISDEEDEDVLEFVSTMNFEQAYGSDKERDGEEIYTMPASSSSRKQGGGEGSGGVAC